MTDDDMAVRDRMRQLVQVTTVDLDSDLEEMKIMPTVELKRLFETTRRLPKLDSEDAGGEREQFKIMETCNLRQLVAHKLEEIARNLVEPGTRPDDDLEDKEQE